MSGARDLLNLCFKAHIAESIISELREIAELKKGPNLMKEQVLQIVKSASGGAGDNLARAKMAFKGKNEAEMGCQWGQSGKTCQVMLDEYQQHYDEIKRCVAWVESR